MSKYDGVQGTNRNRPTRGQSGGNAPQKQTSTYDAKPRPSVNKVNSDSDFQVNIVFDKEPTPQPSTQSNRSTGGQNKKASAHDLGFEVDKNKLAVFIWVIVVVVLLLAILCASVLTKGSTSDVFVEDVLEEPLVEGSEEVLEVPEVPQGLAPSTPSDNGYIDGPTLGVPVEEDTNVFVEAPSDVVVEDPVEFFYYTESDKDLGIVLTTEDITNGIIVHGYVVSVLEDMVAKGLLPSSCIITLDRDTGVISVVDEDTGTMGIKLLQELGVNGESIGAGKIQTPYISTDVPQWTSLYDMCLTIVPDATSTKKYYITVDSNWVHCLPNVCTAYDLMKYQNGFISVDPTL